MEVRYALRKSPLIAECQVAPEIFEQLIPRLEAFMKPFVSMFQGQAAAQHAKTSVCGLLSNVERKNIASIAYRFGHSRLPLQDFIGCDTWDDASWCEELQGQIRRHLGQGDGVLVFDPSGFPTSGRELVGVARQWWGRLGKVDHCQVAISLGSVSRKGHTLVDTRLSLPQDWTKETAPRRNTVLKNVSSAAQAKRGWRTMQSATGEDGSIVKHSRYWRLGSLVGETERGKNGPPPSPSRRFVRAWL